MNRIVLTAVCMVLGSVLTVARVTAASNAPDAAAEKHIRQLKEELRAAVVKDDVATGTWPC